jgi:hypothetical protein
MFSSLLQLTGICRQTFPEWLFGHSFQKAGCCDNEGLRLPAFACVVFKVLTLGLAANKR